MDLVSRGIRAHVLAQGCVALIALKDLAASARYGKLEDLQDETSIRFGKFFKTAQTQAQDLLVSAYQSNQGLQIRSYTESESASHAHDTQVGRLSSQLTYLAVFISQAAIPILVLMVLQYTVGRRLATLVREGRENLRQLERRTNRTLKTKRELGKSSSNSSFNVLARRESSSSNPVIKGQSQVVESSPELDARDLSVRLGQVKDFNVPVASFSNQRGFTASPTDLTPGNESSLSVPPPPKREASSKST